MSYESVVKEDAPKGYWRLGEPSGTEAKDASGNAQNGTYKNTPTLGVAGAIGLDSNTAASFASASKQWVSVPDSATLDLGDVLTYEAWVKRASTGTGQTILDKGGGSLIVRFLANNKILVRRNGVANICESTVAITDTTSWHHIVVTKNGATVKIYIDGVDVTGTVTNSTLVNTSVVLGIGAADAGSEEFFNGSIDEAAVYGTALSKARVEAHWAAGSVKSVEGKGPGTGTGSGSASGTRGRVAQGSDSGAGTGSAAGTRGRQGKGAGEGVGSGTASAIRTGQGKGGGAGVGTGGASGTRGRTGQAAGFGAGSGVAEGTTYGSHLSYMEEVLADSPHGYWRLGEASGTLAADASTNGNDGTYKNSVELGLPGGLVTDADTSASFNTGSTLEKDHVLVPDSGSLDLGDTFSLAAWIRRDGTGLTDCILDKGEGSFIFRFDGEDHLLLRRNGVANIAKSTTKITDAGWHYVVATKNGATVKIYIDGVDVTGTVTNSTCVNNAVALTIGASNAGEEDFFRGGIDEVAVYPAVLSAGRVQAHYEAGFIPIPPENVGAPSVSGTPALNETLLADKGTWEYVPTSYAYQWQVSDKEGTGFVGIVGASSATYVVQGHDVGRYVRCTVTAKNASGQTVATSASEHVEGVARPARLWLGASISDYFRQAAPGAITEVPDPGASGRDVFRFDVHKSDVFPITPTEDPRAQLAGPVLEIGEGFVRYPFVDGSEVWSEMAFFLPEGTPALIPKWMQIVQGFGPPFEGVAPWAIKLASDYTLIWQRNSTYGFDIPWEHQIEPGQWVRILKHERLAADGWIEMWVNGQSASFFAPGASYNPHEEAETERLEMATLDASNDGEFGNTIWLQNYWAADSFEEAVVYHEPTSVWLGLSDAAPVVATKSAQGIVSTKATLRGEVHGRGLATTYWFEYATLADYEAGGWAKASSTPKASAGEIGAFVTVSHRLDALLTQEDYVYRLLASSMGGEAEGETESFTTIERPNQLRIREAMPMDVLVLVTTPGGKTFDWSENGHDAGSLLEDMADSGSVPGGNKDWSAMLPRKLGIDYSDMKRGSKVELFGAGQMPLSVYRLTRAPQVSGDKLSVTPAAQGYEGHLVDDNTAQEIFIDADQTAFGEPSARRRASFPAGDKVNQGGSVSLVPAGSPDPANPADHSHVPAISHSWSEISSLSGRDSAESWYSSGGVPIGQVRLDFLNVRGLEPGDANWTNAANASETDYGGNEGHVFEGLEDFDATTTVGAILTVGPDRFFISLEDYYSLGIEVQGSWETQWRNIRVFGRHELPVYGTWPAIGLLASDVVAYALSRWAPQVHFTTGPNGTIKQSNFVIPHLVFKEPTTAAEMIQQATRFEIPEWGVWAGQFGPTFYMNPRGQREGSKRWRARVHEVEFEDAGQQLDQTYNGVVVLGQAADGSTIYVGPPDSGLRYTSERLIDRDPQNPANEAGITHYKPLPMKGIATIEGMEEAGEDWLQQNKLLDGAGKATLTGRVEDEKGRRWPYYCVEAGDEIELIGSSIPGYRYITNASRSRSSRSVSIDIDAPPDAYEAMMERLNAELVGLALG